MAVISEPVHTVEDWHAALSQMVTRGLGGGSSGKLIRGGGGTGIPQPHLSSMPERIQQYLECSATHLAAAS